MSALLAQQWFTPAQLVAEIEMRTGAALQIDTLSKWRSRGIGPAFIKLSRTAVAYAHEDVEAWLQGESVIQMRKERRAATSSSVEAKEAIDYEAVRGAGDLIKKVVGIQDKRLTVYVIGNLNFEVVKIGVGGDVSARMARIQSHCPVPLELLCSFPGSHFTERCLHQRFDRDRMHGEWFWLSPTIELFVRNMKFGEAAA